MFSCTRKSLQRTVVCNITMTTHGTGENTRTKLRELLVRHHELEQNKNKAQGALLTILFMTQITELKMLLDIGRKHHRFYEFVLALLIASVSLQVCFGMIIIYIGHLQYYKEPHQKKVSFGRRILQCLLCKCRLRTKCCQNNKMKTRRHSYLDVPIGVGAPEGKFEDPLDNISKDSYDPHEDGCVQFPPKKITEDFPNFEKRKSVLEAANVKLSECVAKILRISNEVEHLEDATKSCPTNPDLQEDLNHMRGDLQIAKRHKMEAEAEWNIAESRMKQTVLACEQWEERQEKAVFKRITRWQQCATYLLYFIMLMNVFVTAFGISGGHFDGSLLVRHHELEQNKNKAQGALLTILFMTQITELKMLLDIGRKHHRFYEFVLALLIASVSLQVCFGMIIIYIGHLQYYKEPHQKKVSFGRRILQCLLCKCRLRTKCCQNNKMKTRRHSYLDVPIGVGAPEGKFEDPLDNISKDSYDPHEDGCVQFPPKKFTEDFPNIEKRKSVLEAANVKLSECVAKILRISNEVEHLEDATKSCPTNPDLQEDLNRMRGDLQIAKRHKMEAEAEWNIAESRMKQTVLACEQWEERQEKAVFKRITRWQQCATYLLYFIMLMNVFVTAFGISGGHFDGSVNTTNHTIN